jgi:hypothetical protein
MGFTQTYTGANPYGGYGPGMMGMMYGGYGPGMMGMMNGSFGPGMMGMMNGNFGPGMMGNMMMSPNSPFYTAKPLSIAEAKSAVETYLTNWGDNNLKLAEIMLFDNQAYAEIVEKDTGRGAMELLVDPATQTVYPEHGPNMMWNLKYGMMSGGPGRGMMGFNRFNQPPSTNMTVSPEEAVTVAQSYLDTNFASANLKAEEATPFYGYYTLDLTHDGQMVGMLSVNGYTQAVFPHTWHGKLLEISELE